jgi:thioredoxin reductase (NADPH)
MWPLVTVNEMSVIDTGRSQVFPFLDGVQLGIAKRFGGAPARSFRPGEIIFDVGAWYVPTWLVLEGSIEVVFRDGLRAGSTKRVAAAVGEGAAVVAQIHSLLAKELGS